MVRNSDTLYRLVRLNSNQASPPGAVDCQPYNLPVYCVVPVTGSYDRPTSAYFSVDGTTAYVLNCGPECGGSIASVSVLQQALAELQGDSRRLTRTISSDNHDPGARRGDHRTL